MKVRFLSAAEEEVTESVAFYYSESPQATLAFLEEIDDAADAIGAAPYQYPVYADHVRVRQLDRFPFSIFYRIDGDEAIIQSVAHNSRYPGYWKNR